MKPIKNLPIYVLSGALVFFGVASASQAQAAWTSKETARIKALESKIQKLEKQASSLESYVYDFADVYDAQAKYEVSEIQKLDDRLTVIEASNGSDTFVTIRYLATSGGTGFVKDICPGIENLQNLPSYMPSGRLLPRTDIFGREVTDISGKSVTPDVYECKMQVLIKKKN